MSKRLVVLLGFALMSLQGGLMFSSSEASERLSTSRTVLTGTVRYSDEDIPPEIFGTWQRTRTLLESTFPNPHEPLELGYWTIEKRDNQLILTNPDNGASTAIQLQAVHGKTATFVYNSHQADGSPCKEELSLTATQNNLQGVQRKVCRTRAQQTRHAVARVSGFRLDQGDALW